jgi:heat shock protein HtpX
MSTKNTLKTGLLLAALTGVLAVAGHLVGGTTGLAIALLFAVAMNGATYWFSDRLALAMAHARPVARSEAPLLYAQIEDLAAGAAVPVPAVYLIADPSPNAFATGRNPRHAAVAATTGILQLLDQRELRGVLAHEFAHIKNRDILLTTVAATMAGAISALANMFQFATLFGSHDEDEEGGSMLGGLAMLILAPLAATLIQLAISRAREYAADATGARLCGEPRALASALGKLERGTWLRPMQVNPAAAPLFIVHPFAGGGLLKLFSTHPPITERIARLEAMASQSASQGWGRAGVAG